MTVNIDCKENIYKASKENMFVAPNGDLYSMDSFETKLNNNVLVVGGSGSYKTRGVVIPNLMAATGSYIVSDPKGYLYRKYKDYMKDRGYKVIHINFRHPDKSDGFNMFKYLKTVNDIQKLANILCINKDVQKSKAEPYWYVLGSITMGLLIGYLLVKEDKSKLNLTEMMRLASIMESYDEKDSRNDKAEKTARLKERERERGRDCRGLLRKKREEMTETEIAFNDWKEAENLKDKERSNLEGDLRRKYDILNVRKERRQKMGVDTIQENLEAVAEENELLSILNKLELISRQKEESHKKEEEYLNKIALERAEKDALEESEEWFDNLIQELKTPEYKGNELAEWCLRQYQKVKLPDKTFYCVLGDVYRALGGLDTPEIVSMMQKESISFEDLGNEKTVVFVEVSDTDRSKDKLINVFYTQAMNVLCDYADEKCEDGRLKVPVRFILDDFGTNCIIDNFENIISNIRSRNISATIILQSEAQLTTGYNESARTIIENCDTYIYMGGNDLETVEHISKKANKTLSTILDMPLCTNWIFRRGKKPVFANTVDVSEYTKFADECKVEVVEDKISDCDEVFELLANTDNVLELIDELPVEFFEGELLDMLESSSD